MVKIYYTRHGHSFHNELYENIGEKAYTHPSVIGSSLTSKGIKQTQILKQEIEKLENFDLILVSPLDRCLQTVEQVIKNLDKVPEIISLDEMIEYEITDTANYRKNKKDLLKIYPFVNFNYIVDNFITPTKDDFTALKQRIKSFNKFISTLDSTYQRILVVGHTSWLNMLLFDNPESSDLEHCKIYTQPVG
jgi:broad specificity phosphatase PhoE